MYTIGHSLEGLQGMEENSMFMIKIQHFEHDDASNELGTQALI